MPFPGMLSFLCVGAVLLCVVSLSTRCAVADTAAVSLSVQPARKFTTLQYVPRWAAIRETIVAKEHVEDGSALQDMLRPLSTAKGSGTNCDP